MADPFADDLRAARDDQLHSLGAFIRAQRQLANLSLYRSYVQANSADRRHPR